VIDDPSERLVEELFDQRAPDTADEVVSLEGQAAMRMALTDMLSPLEVEVLRLHLEGCSYSVISDRLGRHVKAVDNALQRIKRKVEAHLVATSTAQRVSAA
jgi:RNA polymerase sporulation-specific sigma factor